MARKNDNLETPSIQRETFSSGLAIFFATLGSTVGLGNIWKFPYLTGANGGGAFVLIYLICILLVGIPIMVSEFYIGRRTQSNAVGAFVKLKASRNWKVIGYMGVLSAAFIMFFYSAVAGWVYSYTVSAIKGDFKNLAYISIDEAINVVGDQFSLTVGGSFMPILWQLIVLIVVSIILIAGIKNGIEKVTKSLMPILFLLIVICGVRALTLEGASQGLNFLFSIDFSKITPSVILSALGLAFFKLSVGMGTMITYSSYFTDHTNLITTSTKVAFSDTIVSLLAGIAIFPVVFTFGLEPEAGPGLLFNTIPLVFSKIPFGNILLIAFFLLTSIAATTAMISLAEVPVAFMVEEWNIHRKKAVLITTSTMFIIGALTVHPTSIFANITISGKDFFNLFDYLSSNVLLPIGGLLISIFAGYLSEKSNILDELSNKGTLNNRSIIRFYMFIIKYISPILLLIVFLTSIGIINF